MRAVSLFIFSFLLIAVSNAQVPAAKNTTLPCNNWLYIPSQPGYVDVGTINITGTQLTVEANFNRTSFYANNVLTTADIVSKHSGPFDANYALRTTHCLIRTSVNFFATPEPCGIDSNKTYHVAMVYDGATLKFYRNGFLMSQVNATGTLFQNSLKTYIGWLNTQNLNENFVGYLNEVRIWNVARTQAQIQTYVNTSLPSPSTQTGLLAYYQFNDLLNKQGNPAYNGTLGGSASINATNPQCAFPLDSCYVPVSIGNIINNYTPAISLSPCDNKLTVEDAAAFKVGDTVLLIQMKGAVIDSSNTAAFGTITNYKNAGNYEFNYVKSKAGNVIELKDTLTRQYDFVTGKVQLIRVPYFKSVTVSSTLTCLPWDGSKGGVLVFNVRDSVYLNADINVNGKGFTGGNGVHAVPPVFNCDEVQYYYPAVSDLGSGKGESIASLSAAKMSGRGKFANGGGGGNSHNSGGGGGGNGNNGGMGGYQFEGSCTVPPFDNRGVNAVGLTYSNAVNKVFLGGGGGAGHANNPELFSPNGGNGGGICIISANVVAGNNRNVLANGDSGRACSGFGPTGCHEGMGGGGAGGTILLQVNSYPSVVNAKAKGGKGADMVQSGNLRVAPGGGGGGGICWMKNASLPANLLVDVTGSANGVCTGYANDAWGATAGSNGSSLFNLVVPNDTIIFKPNIDSVRIKDSLTGCRTYDFKGLAYTSRYPISSWQWYFGDAGTAGTQNTSHTYATAGTYIVKLVVTDVNGCKDSVSKTLIVLTCSGISNIINTYTPVLGFNPCDNKITVEDASTFNVGDTVLIIQMKGAVIDSTNTAAFGTITNYKNSGNYEFNYVKSKTGNIVELRDSLVRQYDIPVGSVQLIRVPYFISATVTSTLTCLPWDGRKGGVLVFNVRDTLDMVADINTTGKGFLKGTMHNSNFNGFTCGVTNFFYPDNTRFAAGKGEGITSLSTAKNSGKGPAANGGGGGMDTNSGGGGGSNGNTGGRGGYELDGCPNHLTSQNWGLPGKILPYNTAQNRIFMGGAGGAGHSNNQYYDPTANADFNGGNGGGIVLISSAYIKNSNNSKIISKGDTAYELNMPNSFVSHDGMGGGGAGGTVLLNSSNYINTLLVDVSGGRGGNMVSMPAGGLIGPGGGGGGGVVWVKQSSLPAQVVVTNAGGTGGVIIQNGNDPYGAAPGLTGINVVSFSLPLPKGAFMKNIDSVRIKDSLTGCRTYDFKGLAYVRNSPIVNWQWTFGDATGATGQNTSHTYGTAGTYTVKLVVTDVNGCKDSISKTLIVLDCAGISNIINTYTPVLGFNPCDNKLTVEDASTFNVGDTVLIIQMKGAVIDSSNTAAFGTITNYNNSGNYEFNYVKAKAGNIVELRDSLSRQYDIPVGKVQLIRVPYFLSTTVTSTLTCLPWDGKKGGVLVFNVRDTLDLLDDINTTGKGFLKGTMHNSNSNTYTCDVGNYYHPDNTIDAAGKGEGITFLSPARNSGKGPAANGGGGGMNANTGGGGGSNGNKGGRGGDEYNDCVNHLTAQNWGFPGNTVAYNTIANKIFMGGAGGAGHCNNQYSDPSVVADFNGGNGGGLILISSNYIKNSGSKKIISKGDVAFELNITNSYVSHDGMGGGGAGGTVLLNANNYLNSIPVDVSGGRGGNMQSMITGGWVGPGGGGGGGVVWVKQNSLPAQVVVTNAGGPNGVVVQDANNPYGATAGLAGINVVSFTVPAPKGLFLKNIDSVRIKDSLTGCRTYDFKGLAYVKNSPIVNWQWTFGDATGATGQNTSHTYATGGTYTVKLVVTDANGCKDSISKNITIVPPVITNVNTNVSICAGQTYTLPTGTTVGTSGTYNDTLHYIGGCDSVRRSVNLTVQQPTSTTTNAFICAGQSYSLPWGTVVSTAGTYYDTLHYITGCDSIRRTVNLTVQSPTITSTNVSICAGQSYTTPWGTTINTAGTYNDTLHYTSGCDSIRRSIVLTVQTVAVIVTNASICAGQTYTLPWGPVVNTTGTYGDTLHYLTGCDSVRKIVNLIVQQPATVNTNAFICAGQTYTLPSGTVVSTPGTYYDTLHYVTGCDSIRRTVNLTVQNFTTPVNNVTICSGQSYTLPSGTVVNTTGVYNDTLHYVSGCDSVRRTVNLTVQNVTVTNTNASICAGQSYTLPWGPVVNTSGTYGDTTHYLTGCDSTRKIVNLTVQQPTAVSTSPFICAGQTYTLPSGTVVSTPGTYYDTLHYVTGCDSIRRTVNLTVQNFTTPVNNVTICAGQSYTLPSGTVVNTTGVYNDTLHYVSGCDSVRRTVNLTVQSVQTAVTNASICAGQTYTLPWGPIVNSSGTYTDTLHYLTGCDSVRKTVNLVVQQPTAVNTSPFICAGQTYTLPSGTVVSTPGTYYDTLHYVTGCDSIRRSVTLTVQNFTTPVNNVTICAGQSYTLPSGTVVSTTGTYNDTLHYVTGCDSVRTTVNLTVQTVQTAVTNASICAGQSYTLPWGPVVNSSGTYADTLHYLTGCDSVRKTVNLTVQQVVNNNSNGYLCAGQSYTLPWGTVVNTPGNYYDTLHYITGCDSVRKAVNLTLQSASASVTNATICAGQTYTLPSGVTVNATGIYNDTLHYVSGCDSVRRTVNLTVQSVASNLTNASVCAGQSYTLPWGTVVSTTGNYSDTLHYATGCDSVRRTVHLNVTAAVVANTTAAICSDQQYTLPWGGTVNVPGLYQDTLRTLIGCDSLIRRINLSVNPAPLVSASKSNDINCSNGQSVLNATGASTYLWSPPTGLSNPLSPSPVATPGTTTLYTVTGTDANGCSNKALITVSVNFTGKATYLMPNSFTPNGDGLNDCFGPKYFGVVTELVFMVYNRYGERVFYTEKPGDCWDGRYKGKIQNQGNYVYYIKAKTACAPVELKGNVILLR